MGETSQYSNLFGINDAPKPSRRGASTAKRKLATSDLSTVRVRLSVIIPDSAQPRQEFDEEAMRELKESIANRGAIQPLMVRRSPNNDGLLIIVVGERRWRALKDLGLSQADVIITDVSDPYEIRLLQTDENKQRSGLTLEDEANNVAITARIGKEKGIPKSKIAEDMGYNPTEFSSLLAYAVADERVRQLSRTGRTRNVMLLKALADVLAQSEATFAELTADNLAPMPLVRNVLAELKSGTPEAKVLVQVKKGREEIRAHTARGKQIARTGAISTVSRPTALRVRVGRRSGRVDLAGLAVDATTIKVRFDDGGEEELPLTARESVEWIGICA